MTSENLQLVQSRPKGRGLDPNFRINEPGLPGGILLLTEQAPTLEELNQAVRDFHLYPVIRETAIVPLLDAAKLSQSDREFLRALGVPGYEEDPQEPQD